MQANNSGSHNAGAKPESGRVILTEFGFLAILVMVGCAWLAEQAFSDHALSPHSAWPYSASRDAGLADTGAGGYPTCKQRWANDTVGLKARLLQLPALDIWTAFKKIDQSQVVYEEAVLRSRVSERNMQVSQNGRVYPSYGGNVDGTVANAATRLASGARNILGSIAACTAFDSVR